MHTVVQSVFLLVFALRYIIRRGGEPSQIYAHARVMETVEAEKKNSVPKQFRAEDAEYTCDYCKEPFVHDD